MKGLRLIPQSSSVNGWAWERRKSLSLIHCMATSRQVSQTLTDPKTTHIA